MRGATLLSPTLSAANHVSIHAPHARRDLCARFLLHLPFVSIHAPHARRDCKRFHGRFLLPHIRGYYLPQICFFLPFCPTALLRYGIPIIFITVFSVHSTFAHIKSCSNKTYINFPNASSAKLLERDSQYIGIPPHLPAGDALYPRDRSLGAHYICPSV